MLQTLIEAMVFVALLLILLRQRVILMTLDELKAKVQANTDVTTSAVTLINGLAEQLRAIATDPVAIQALADQLDAADKSLAAAIQANTPTP